MVRISDIFKKKEEPEKEPEAPKETPSEPAPVILPVEAKISKAMPKEEPREEHAGEMQIAKAMKELQPDIAQAKNLYVRALILAKELFINAEEKKPIELKPIKDFVDEIVNYFILGDKTLVSLFYDGYPPEEYLYYHIVNVTIMCIGLAMGLRYNKSRISDLALAAFLHDIGMIKHKDIALMSRTLSPAEYEKIKEHPTHSLEILSQIKDISQEIISAIKEQHESYDGKGYPSAIKNGSISEYARIICIADVYEALTHERTYRKKYLPYDAIKEMFVSMASHFDPALIKVLVSQVGVYPIGSWVELNTNEIGRVIAVDEEFPLRPVVNIIFDHAKRQLAQPRLVNLAKQYNLYIKKSLSDKEVAQETKK